MVGSTHRRRKAALQVGLISATLIRTASAMGPACLVTGRSGGPTDNRRAVTHLIWAMWGMPFIELPTADPAPDASSWLQRLASPRAGARHGRRRRSQSIAASKRRAG